MKRALVILVACCLTGFLVGCDGGKQTANNTGVADALKRFPGINEQQMAQLLWVKEQICLDRNIDETTVKEIEQATGGKCRIPLPTWIPAGFKIERLDIKVGKETGLDSLRLALVYSRSRANNKKQVFMIEAGFEFGDLPYEGHYLVKSVVGDICLYYEPINDTINGNADSWGKPILNVSETEWFGTEKLRYPLYTYVSSALRLAQERVVDTSVFEMISLGETKKILTSMEEL